MEEEKKLEEEERLKPKKKKRGCLINLSFFFYMFCFSITTHLKLFLYVCKVIFVCILNFYDHKS